MHCLRCSYVQSYRGEERRQSSTQSQVRRSSTSASKQPARNQRGFCRYVGDYGGTAGGRSAGYGTRLYHAALRRPFQLSR